MRASELASRERKWTEDVIDCVRAANGLISKSLIRGCGEHHGRGTSEEVWPPPPVWFGSAGTANYATTVRRITPTNNAEGTRPMVRAGPGRLHGSIEVKLVSHVTDKGGGPTDRLKWPTPERKALTRWNANVQEKNGHIHWCIKQTELCEFLGGMHVKWRARGGWHSKVQFSEE
ncbi:hypothetical protein K438DRAFT_1781970 [Mycena galopus ATCC 62051]|nr:hypothetical protein K438DRAFT_1781970 [Mycena galopus ATCC 62051]